MKWGNKDKLLEREGNQKQYQVLLRRQTKRGEGCSTQSNRCSEKVTQDLHHEYRRVVYKNSCTKPTRSGGELGAGNNTAAYLRLCVQACMSVCNVCVCTLSMEKISVFGVQHSKTEI